MKRFALILAVAALPAAADWTVLSQSAEMTISAETTRTPAGKPGAWALVDYPQIQPGGYRSQRMMFEADCPRTSYRILVSSVHAGSKASGRVLQSVDTPDDAWKPVPPDTVGAVVWLHICAGK